MKKDYIYIFLISFIPQLIILLLSPPILFWDEYSYLDNVKHALLNTPYFEYYRFPLLWWILIPISYITNFNVFFIKLFLISIFSLSTVFLYKILEEYNNVFNLSLFFKKIIEEISHKPYSYFERIDKIENNEYKTKFLSLLSLKYFI